LISLEGPEIRFTVSDRQDLFDFSRKSPIVLGRRKERPALPKLDAGFVHEIKRHRRALRTSARRANVLCLEGNPAMARRKSAPYNERSLLSFFFSNSTQLVIHSGYRGCTEGRRKKDGHQNGSFWLFGNYHIDRDR